MAAAVGQPSATRRPRADARLDAVMVAGCVWLSVGMAVDAWAHKNVPALETFFTPWHAVFYSGFGVVAAIVGGATWRNVRRGRPWRLAAPDGYAKAVVGLAVFVAGALGDAIWHELLGVEKDLAALVSPTHLLLFAGITLFVTSPLRAAWRRPDLPWPGEAARPSLGELMPALLSVALVTTTFSFVTQAASPLVEPFAARIGAATVPTDPRSVFLGQALGLAGFVVQTGLLVGGLLLLLRRWWLPFGAVTVLVMMNWAIQVTLSELYALVPVALGAGLATDWAIGRLLGPDGPRWGVQAVAALLPTTLWGGYMLALGLGVGGGLAWEVELVGGAVIVSAATGLLVSLLVDRRAPSTAPHNVGMDDATSSLRDIDDWHPGRRINLRGRKKVVVAAGMLSRSGEALRQFDGFIRYLENNFGYTRGDILEVSYASAPEGDDWRPAPYDTHHCDVSLREASAQVGRSLRWYRARLPDDTEYHLIGYSLGGVALFEAVGALLLGEPSRWQGRIGSLTTLSAPLFGADLGIEGELLGALGLGTLLPGRDSARELLERGRDPKHRALVDRLAARLGAAGVRIMTLADANDVVVTPEDAIIAPPRERERHVLSGPRVPGSGPGLGHGPILTNTLAWVRMAKQLGPQEAR